MRYVHPAALAGLLLNLILIYVLFSAINSIDISMLPEQDRAVVQLMIDAAPSLRPVFYFLIGAQALALALICMRVSFGLILSAIMAFLMLPASLLYFVGCLLTRDKVRYAGYPVAPDEYASARSVFPSAAWPKMRTFTAVIGLFALLFFFVGSVDLTLVFLSLAMVGAYCMVRAKSHQALSLHDDYFTLWPGLFAPRLLIPYSSVRLATLHDDESISFDLETPFGPTQLRWSLRTVLLLTRRSALEHLGAELTARDIPLR